MSRLLADAVPHTYAPRGSQTPCMWLPKVHHIFSSQQLHPSGSKSKTILRRAASLSTLFHPIFISRTPASHSGS